MIDFGLIFVISGLPVLLLSSWILGITLRRKSTLQAASRVWNLEALTVLELPNGDLHLWLERKKGYSLLLSGAIITLFSVPLITVVLPIINLAPLAEALGSYLAGMLIGLPLWLTLGGLVPLTFGAEWFQGNDILISKQARTVTARSFFLQLARTWNFADFFGLLSRREQDQTTIILNFKNRDIRRKNLQLATVPAGHAEQALHILRASLGTPIL